MGPPVSKAPPQFDNDLSYSVLDRVTRHLLGAARLAPSAHNSQPWRFSCYPSSSLDQGVVGSIVIGYDPVRRLPYGDPHRRYLLTGIGAAAESIRLAAGEMGLRGEIERCHDLGTNGVVLVRLGRDTFASTDAHLATRIAERRTTRLAFEPAAVPVGELARLEKVAAAAQAHFSVIDTRPGIDAVAEAIGEGTAANFADSAVFGEFCDWLRRHGDDRPDGLTWDALGFRGVDAVGSRLILDPQRMRVLRRLGLHRIAANTQCDLARKTPAICLLSISDNSSEAWIQGGQAMLRVWLAATAANLSVHPMTAAMDHPATRAVLADRFGVPNDDGMVLCFRLGYASDPVARSSRLPLAQLIDNPPGGLC